MNYLAHLHIAAVTETSLIGNFLGDFAKGSDFSALDPDVAAGIKLHRKVDSYTDNHAIIKSLKGKFPTSLRRMAGVSIDIWFDHLLLKHNQNWQPMLKTQVLEVFYLELAEFEYHTPRFLKVQSSLLKHRWLLDYQQQQTCLQAFYTIEKRLRNKLIFADAAFGFIQENQAEIEAEFLSFYPDLINYSQAQALPDQFTKMSST